MKPGLAWILPATTLLIGIGCGGISTTRRSPLRVKVHSPGEVIGSYNRQCPPPDRLRAQATIEYKSGEVKKSFDGVIYMESGGEKVRLRGDAYFVTIFDMTFVEDHFTVLVPSKNTCYRGEGDSFRGFAMQDLREALAPRPLVESQRVVFEEDRRQIVLTEVAAGDSDPMRPVQRVYLSRSDLSLGRRTLYYPTGVVKSDIYYGKATDFKAGRFPSKITVNRPWQEITVTLNLQKFEIPPVFKPDLFALALPEGTKTVDLESDVSEDILFGTSDGSDN